MNINFKSGDIYTDNNNKTSYVRLSNGKWRVLSSPYYTANPPVQEGSSIAPAQPAVGQTWVDIANDTAIPYVWDGDEWLQISPSTTEGSDLGTY